MVHCFLSVRFLMRARCFGSMVFLGSSFFLSAFQNTSADLGSSAGLGSSADLGSSGFSADLNQKSLKIGTKSQNTPIKLLQRSHAIAHLVLLGFRWESLPEAKKKKVPIRYHSRLTVWYDQARLRSFA